VPDVKIFSFDPGLASFAGRKQKKHDVLLYYDPNATYYLGGSYRCGKEAEQRHLWPRGIKRFQDWSTCDWSWANKDKVLILFDDHMNIGERVAQMRKLGFIHALYDDNHPSGATNFATPHDACDFTNPRMYAHESETLTSSERLATYESLAAYWEFPPVLFHPVIAAAWINRFMRINDTLRNCILSELSPMPLIQTVGQLQQYNLTTIAFDEMAGYFWLVWLKIRSG
jgi:hypothetical protein